MATPKIFTDDVLITASSPVKLELQGPPAQIPNLGGSSGMWFNYTNAVTAIATCGLNRFQGE